MVPQKTTVEKAVSDEGNCSKIGGYSFKSGGISAGSVGLRGSEIVTPGAVKSYIRPVTKEPISGLGLLQRLTNAVVVKKISVY